MLSLVLGLMDVAVAPVFFGVLGFMVVLAFFVIALLEAAVLTAARWAGFGRSLVDALLVNLVSTLLGVVFYLMPVGSSWPDLTVFGLYFGLSVLVEGGVLLVRRREHGAGRTWLLAALANVVSYGLIGLYLLVTG
jgi:hypothetical protein